MMNMTPTVKQLLIINILFFAGSFFVPTANTILALHNVHSDDFGVWQLITHMFMHGNFMHIFFNMFALMSFGSALEHFWGYKKFLFFYFSCGLGAAALQLGINYLETQQLVQTFADLNLSDAMVHKILNATIDDGSIYRPDLFGKEIEPILQSVGKAGAVTQEHFNAMFSAARSTQGQMVGASGAIYGLLVAFAFMFPNAELMFLFIPIPIKAKYFVPIFMLLYDGLFGIFGSFIGVTSDVAHFAHLGGAIIGFIMMWYWRKNQFNRNRWN